MREYLTLHQLIVRAPIFTLIDEKLDVLAYRHIIDEEYFLSEYQIKEIESLYKKKIKSICKEELKKNIFQKIQKNDFFEIYDDKIVLKMTEPSQDEMLCNWCGRIWDGYAQCNCDFF